MDELYHTPATLEEEAVESPWVEETSTEYVGRWNRLVSTTNWEKGRIIAAWRKALEKAAAPIGSCSDQAWSSRVGSVSPQHAGRLRRVYERFGRVRKQYSGLYWSHFQVALDWHDAEMWLEGAVQNGWSVAQMRRQRWEAMGAPPELKPRDEDIIQAEFDEDVEPAADSAAAATLTESIGVVQPAEGPPSGDSADSVAAEAAAAPPAPFANLAALPADLSEALEALKLAILRHKLSGWQEVSCRDVLTALEGLKQVVLAPAG
jgi:hypothetical protein